MTRHHYLCPMRWGDMDAQGHINNSAFLDYLQEGRVDFLLGGPPEMGQLLETGVLVASHQVEYLAPVTFSERPLRLELWVDQVGASRFAVGYEVYDGDVLAARARTTATPYDLAAGRLRRLTEVERGCLTGAMDTATPLRPLARLPVTEPAHRYPLVVRWSDLDSYGHVNNVKFYDYVQEARIAVMRATLGWQPEDVWLVARQDLEYRRPLDFRIAPYEVRTSVSALGRRSFTLAAELGDPADASVYATARTVVVGTAPLTPDQRAALSRWAPDTVCGAG
ncbi:acyl-CoA thioesterase [uncultured Friedmanniella sp.]|uniref:acyl-CoA thioesterase n=1 Tax=uncultured Friedmanniella sp. TaxID=335381 RepID=UPI0035CC4A78